MAAAALATLVVLGEDDVYARSHELGERLRRGITSVFTELGQRSRSSATGRWLSTT